LRALRLTSLAQGKLRTEPAAEILSGLAAKDLWHRQRQSEKNFWNDVC
jgi:hypothetical protein